MCVYSLNAQEYEIDSTFNDNSGTNARVQYVFLDCHQCDQDFIRTELTFVNYMCDQDMADIHVFVTDVGTAGGGKEFQFSFIGRKTFIGTEYKLDHHVEGETTAAEQRDAIDDVLTRGLVGPHYFHDFSRQRFVFYGLTSVRLFEGFFLVSRLNMM